MSERIGRDVVERLREALTADEVVTIRRGRTPGREIDVQGDIADLLSDWERLREALEEVRKLTKSASDVFLLRLGSVAAQALYPDWSNGGVAPAQPEEKP